MSQDDSDDRRPDGGEDDTARGGASGGRGATAGRAQATGVQQDSVGEILKRPSVKAQVKYVVALFAVIGAGIGLLPLGGSLASGLAGQLLKAFVAGFGLIVAIVAGPIVAALTTLRIDDRMNDEMRARLVTGFAANAAGYFVMIVLASVLASVTAGGGGGGFGGGSSDLLDLGIGDLLVPLFAFAFVTGAVGAGAVYVREWSGVR
jgi:hypothetical protein